MTNDAVLPEPTRTTFVQIMLNDTNDDSLVTAINAIIDQEAALIEMPAADVQAVKNGMQFAHKAGNIGTAYESDAGWFSLPVNGGADTRQYVFAHFVDARDRQHPAQLRRPHIRAAAHGDPGVAAAVLNVISENPRQTSQRCATEPPGSAARRCCVPGPISRMDGNTSLDSGKALVIRWLEQQHLNHKSGLRIYTVWEFKEVRMGIFFYNSKTGVGTADLFLDGKLRETWPKNGFRNFGKGWTAASSTQDNLLLYNQTKGNARLASIVRLGQFNVFPAKTTLKGFSTGWTVISQVAHDAMIFYNKDTGGAAIGRTR